MEVVRGEAHERLDEAPGAGGPVDLVAVVEHEEQLVLAGDLECVRHERRGRLAALVRLGLVARVDRGRDRGREVLGEHGHEAPEGRDDAGGEGADVAVHAVDGVPGRRPRPGDARRKGALPEPGAGDDDREPAVRPGREPRLELRPVERAVRVARGNELGGTADARHGRARGSLGRPCPVGACPLSHRASHGSGAITAPAYDVRPDRAGRAGRAVSRCAGPSRQRMPNRTRSRAGLRARREVHDRGGATPRAWQADDLAAEGRRRAADIDPDLVR